MSTDEQTYLQDIVNEVISIITSGDISAAVRYIEDAKLDVEEKTALWSRFDSKQRAAMKGHKK